MVCGSIWWYMVAYGGIRWYMVAYGGIWWYMVVYCGGDGAGVMVAVLVTTVIMI